jgi:hypothetical protein
MISLTKCILFLILSCSLVAINLRCSQVDNREVIKNTQSKSYTISRDTSIYNNNEGDTSSLFSKVGLIIDTIKILSVNKKIRKDTAENQYYNQCESWNLTEKKIVEIIKLSKPISSHEFQYQYYVLPCEFNGQLKIDNAMFRYKVNAGSYVVLISSDTTIYLGCASKKCKKYFLTTKDSME